MRWNFWLLVLHVGSDLCITLAYFSIPFALVYFLRKRRDLDFKPIFLLFACFICSCGLTHAYSIYTLWYPDYWGEGYLKALTGFISLLTAALLWPTIPIALRIPSPKTLQQANEELKTEIARREKAENELKSLNEQLEMRVSERTRELEIQTAEVKKLQTNIITVCAWTKRIRDEGCWISFEEFMEKHFHIHFSHGISEEAQKLLELEMQQLMNKKTE